MRQFDLEHDRVGHGMFSRNRLILIGLLVLVFGTLLSVVIWQATRSTEGEGHDQPINSALQFVNCPTTAVMASSAKTPETSQTMSTERSAYTGNTDIPGNKETTSYMTSLPPDVSSLSVTIGHLTVDEKLILRMEYSSVASLSINMSFGGSSIGSARDCLSEQNDKGEELCLEWERDRRLVIKHRTNIADPTSNISGTQSNLDCYDIEWIALNCPKQVLQNCLDVSTSHWYGGYADLHQYWPFEKNTRRLSAYLVNDSYIGEIGGVIDRYFISSSGFGLYIDDSVPLYFSLNDPASGLMCLTAKFDDYPYFNRDNELPFLKYSICHDDNVKAVHKEMSEMYIDKPRGIPDETLFRYPIWSTWAQFHKEINQTNVLEFAKNILEYNFTHAQIEIDDDWTPAYGDMTFNEDKFPNATAMVKELNDMGFRVTIWVHPFFNADSKSFKELALKGFLIRQRDSPVLAITPWWDGQLTGILDVSNEMAVDWYLGQLKSLTQLYNISSFKFDAGETSWLPHVYSAANMSANPSNVYPGKWVELAMRADNVTRHQEVRAMYRTQKYPIFVRMMDKISDWSHDNGLKSIIPGVLTYGILGYPFILPDMIGGNAYNNQPDPELFIRWIQLNAFLPSLQFSIVPWSYNDTVLNIVRKFTELHEQISDMLIKYARNAVLTGEPIIRPIWWLAPTEEAALTCEDQFLLGDEYLIAPIVEQGARSRDIYFPSGEWLDETRNYTVIGPKLFSNYTANIDELPYFRKL